MVPKQKERQSETQFSCNICWRLPEKEMKQYIEIEKSMINNDKTAEDTIKLKNDCESLIYEYKDKISGSLSDLIPNEKKPILDQNLEDYVDWLYGDGAAANKEV